MNVSLFDIIRHKIAIWVVFPLLLVLSVAMYQYAYYSPAAVAIELNQAQLNSLRYGPALEKQTPLDELGTTLQSVKELTNLTLSGVDDYQESKKLSFDEVLQFMGVKTDSGMNLTELETKLDRIIELETVALDSFNDMHEYLIEIDADSVIFERHDVAVEKFITAMQPVKDIRSAFNTASNLDEQQRLLNELDDYLSTQQFKKTHTAEDFENGSLPFGPRNLQAREPLLDLSSLESSLYDPVNVASNSLTQDILRGLTAPSPEPNAEDLAETEEAPQTQEIIDLAESLNNDPVEIYNWVYNNIYSIPSYGAIQGAQYTMDLKAGNPFDTSALLLALLRAAGTPARYAYGTIQVPVEQAMNWVGGAEVPEAATNVMLQGGIPTVLQSYNGEITHVKMEHIWVEAWVDYEPSRGLVNNEGDHWIPMDASFKQYDFEAAQDLEMLVPFNPDSLINGLMANTNTNDNSFAVSGIDHDLIEQAYQDYMTQLEYEISQQSPDATAADILGVMEIPIKQRAPLSAGLPYHVIDRSTQFQNIPDSFKHKFRVRLDYNSWGSTAIDETFNTVTLAGKDISLNFRPASQSDLDLMASYLPDWQPGQAVDLDSFPDTLPGYLIHMNPELLIADEEILATGSTPMGTELSSTYMLYNPAFGWSNSNNKPVAGEYISIILNLQGISSSHMQDISQSAENSILELDTNGLTNITKHDLIGLETKSNITSYMAMNDFIGNITAQQNDIIQYRSPSYGQFNSSISTTYWFGIPRNTNYGGVVMDVDNLSTISASKIGDNEKLSIFTMMSGYRASLLENWIPEQYYNEAGTEALQGMSAAKALSLASQSGQTLYTLDKSNMAELGNITIDSDARTEIRNALLSGSIVTVHATPLTVNRWTGSGYVIQSQNGSAAYKISGGFNGGFLDTAKRGLQSVSESLQSAIDYFGPAYALSGPIRAALGKLKRWVDNFILLIEAVQNCGPAGLILAIPILIAMMIGIAFILKFVSAVGGAVCAGVGFASGGVGAFACMAVWFTVATVAIADIMSSMLENTANYINNSNGLLCSAGAP
ncbi:transglutaminase domain-containing protein [Reinekea sp.]|jgi:hypothetical protein|uniref:transglutaminase domain-containing protein n=1 Tax=Reinekea sp. TaxID=1970455 RepID=UPI0039891602